MSLPNQMSDEETKISLPNRQSGKGNKDFQARPAIWQGTLRVPYQSDRLVRKENQEFLPKPGIWQ